MFEFGEEFIIEGYKTPWLIWIQLVITILLLLLLIFGFAIFSLDSPSNNSSDPTTAYRAACHSRPSSSLVGSSNSSDANKRNGGNEGSNGEIQAIASQGNAAGGEDIEEDGCKGKDATLHRLFGRPQHPCSYFGLAKQAVLKCLGLDFSKESSQSQRHLKEE